MNDTDALVARIDALETSRAHQDRAIEELSEALAAQWKQIDALNRQPRDLAVERIDEVGSGAGAGSGETDPPPPHY